MAIQGKEMTKGGFEKESSQIIQGSMPFGVLGIDRISVPRSQATGGPGPEEIPGQNDPRMKFIRIKNPTGSPGDIFITDPDAPADVTPGHASGKGGDPIEPGDSQSYPMRGYDEDNSKDVAITRPFKWYTETAGVIGIVTRG